MSKHPIPTAALDDRLAIVGTAGSGKTYLTIGSIERLLAQNSRVISIDPLGVQWGLRLKPDGKTPSPFNIVIFGGAHGDLPLNEHAGALIGETVATMRESCIIDLSQIGTKAAERRFMLAFLTALYRHANKEPVHLVVDEADMWAPQKLLDKDGDAAKLLGMMETIVRRGRVKGFIPWLITQRPAVLSKDVLSQADGIIALKLTAQQDHAAVGGWIEATADTGQWKAIKGALATKQRGEGVLWIPGRDILEDVTFSANTTFDSSRTPKRGEKIAASSLHALDLTKLKDKLATVVAETKANDPKVLKAEIRRLEKGDSGLVASLRADLKTEYERGKGDAELASEAALQEAKQRGFAEGWKACAASAKITFDDMPEMPVISAPPARRAPATPSRPAPTTTQPAASTSDASLTAPQARVLEALSFWSAIGIEQPTRIQVGVAASYSPKSGNFNNILGGLRALDLIDYPSSGLLTITDLGRASAPALEAKTTIERVTSILSASQEKVLRAILEHGMTISRTDLGVATDYSAKSGNFNNLLGSLRSLGLIEYPSTGFVAAHDWLNA